MRRASSERESTRTLTPRQVREKFDALIVEHRYIGVRNFAADIMLEPRNPFQPANRPPKKWVVAVGALGGLTLALIYAFHLR